MALPTLFISHGAPDLPIRQGPTQEFLRGLAQTLPQPEAILILSAHWLTAQPTVSGEIAPATMYDFGGFSPELYALTYPAPGSPDLADRVVKQLTKAGIPSQTHPNRGFDHGSWTPLILAYPDTTVPVVQLSIQPRQGPDFHYQLGQALAPLREAGVLIIGSGAATHNLGAFDAAYEAAPPDWAVEFDDWLTQTIQHHQVEQLLRYRELAPQAVRNHPSEEHLLPLFVALGAGGPGQQIHQGFTYGAFSMAAFQFGADC